MQVGRELLNNSPRELRPSRVLVSSEFFVSFEHGHFWCILTKAFVDVVLVHGIACVLLIVRALLALIENLLTSRNVLFEHLSSEDVIDFDVMSRESVVHEAGWEHDVKAGVPVHGIVLTLEVQEFFAAGNVESGQDRQGDEEPDEETREVDWALSDSDRTG